MFSVMVNLDGSADDISIKLIDFGLSRQKEDIMTPSMCTYMWMAPEMTDKHHYDEKCDVYSYGVILHELLFCQTPFKSSNMKTLLDEKKALSFNTPASEVAADLMYVKMWTLMKNCLAFDKKDRLSFE